MTSFDHSALAQSLLIPLSLRLADVRDWISRVPLTERFSITGTVVSIPNEAEPETIGVCLNLHFSSYKEALAWAWMHAKCHDSTRGYDGRKLYDISLLLPLPDFEVWCWFPHETHPDQLNPELANLKPTTA